MRLAFFTAWPAAKQSPRATPSAIGVDLDIGSLIRLVLSAAPKIGRK
jgi:hypothetical protein